MEESLREHQTEGTKRNLHLLTEDSDRKGQIHILWQGDPYLGATTETALSMVDIHQTSEAGKLQGHNTGVPKGHPQSGRFL